MIAPSTEVARAAHRRHVASGAFDELLDRVWDMGGGPVIWGDAPGGSVWVGFHGPDRWEEVIGHTLDFCAMALKATVLDTDEEAS